MAIQFSISPSLGQISAGDEAKKEGTFALDNSYPTGGYPFNASALALSQINRIIAATNGGYLFAGSYSQQSASSANLKVFQVVSPSTNEQEQSTNTMTKNLATNSIASGTVKTPYASITLSQNQGGVGPVIVTANVVAFTPASGGNPNIFQVSGISGGTFDATHSVTGTNADSSTFTFTPIITLADLWTLSTPVGAFLEVTSNTGQVLTQVINSGPTTGTYAVLSPTQIVTLDSDGWSSLNIAYLSQSSGGGIQEVVNGTDLSALTAVPFEAYGY